MKLARLANLILAAAVLAAAAVLPKKLALPAGENYTFYTGTSSADCREVRSSFNAEVEKLFLGDVCGESAEYVGFDLDKFLNGVNGQVVFTEELSDSVNYYCTADMPYSVSLYGKKINLHISVREGRTKVGTPIIFGGY